LNPIFIFWPSEKKYSIVAAQTVNNPGVFFMINLGVYYYESVSSM
jgi:hypothetical protein